MSRLWKGGGNYFVCIYCIGTELHLQFALRCVVLCCVVLCCVVLCCVVLRCVVLRSGVERCVLLRCAMSCVMSTLPQPRYPVALETQIFG